MNGKIEPLVLDFSGGVTKNQMLAIVSKINELVAAANKQTVLEINLNQLLGDASRSFLLSEALQLSKDYVRAIGIRLRFLGKEGRYLDYSYTGTDLEESSWLDESNWCFGLSTVDGGLF